MFELENAIWGYYARIDKKEIYIKIISNSIPVAYQYSWKWAIDDSKEEITLDSSEWRLIFQSVLEMEKKATFWKVMSFTESLWWTDETIRARRSVIWQLLR